MKHTDRPQTFFKTDGARMINPKEFRVDESDKTLFQRELSSFVPPKAFDFHAHLYDLAHLANGAAKTSKVTYELYLRQQRAWMGNLAPTQGLFFPFPSQALNVEAANDFLIQDLKPQTESKALMMITPRDEPVAVENRVRREGWSGFKVYHVFAVREDTSLAGIEEFLPVWAWEIAHRHELVIMLHMVRPRALADEKNQKYIREYCRKYPGSKLILAHAARGFCGAHTVEGISATSGLDNVYFDTSAICEAAPLEAVLRTYGPTRLLYGSDFPVSETHGRCIGIGDGFHWLYEWQHESWPHGRPALIGLESLLALKQACRNMSLNDSDIERIFKDNARELLGLSRANPQNEQQLYREAKQLIPGGTQLLSKRPEMYAPEVWPPYFQEARGIEVLTLDGRTLLDFSTCGIGSCLLGYAHPVVTEAVLRRVRLGAMSTLNPPEEVELARRLTTLHPWSQQVRFARTGGEALSAAVRIARAATRRDVVAFCGYHGWSDWYLAANLAGESSLAGHLLPGLDPSGVPRGLTGTVVPFHYDDLEELDRIVSEHGHNLAAIVMEPTRSVHPRLGFLDGVRALCDESGARLIFDEVTTGFRLHNGGAHLKYDYAPDIAVFAKALGNGHPIAAIIGRESSMVAAQYSFVSSTYWTESVGPAAALSVLEVMDQVDVPGHIERIGERVQDGLRERAAAHAVPVKVSGHPCLTTFGFDHKQSGELLTLYTTEMLERGFLAGGNFYPTLAHRAEHVIAFLQAADEALAHLGVIIARDNIVDSLKTPVKHSGFIRLN